MTWIGTRVSTTLGLATGLWTGNASIFTLAWPMAGFTAGMVTTFELLAADFSTAHLSEPTRLVLELVLPTETGLCCMIWTFGAAFVIEMTVV
jgi:hypothetical protein